MCTVCSAELLYQGWSFLLQLVLRLNFFYSRLFSTVSPVLVPEPYAPSGVVIMLFPNDYNYSIV